MYHVFGGSRDGNLPFLFLPSMNIFIALYIELTLKLKNMNKLRQELDELLKTIEEYVVNKNQECYKAPLAYRLGIIEEKFEATKPVFSTMAYNKMIQDIDFARAILS